MYELWPDRRKAFCNCVSLVSLPDRHSFPIWTATKVLPVVRQNNCGSNVSEDDFWIYALSANRSLGVVETSRNTEENCGGKLLKRFSQFHLMRLVNDNEMKAVYLLAWDKTRTFAQTCFLHGTTGNSSHAVSIADCFGRRRRSDFAAAISCDPRCNERSMFVARLQILS
jgi:hypothetical protein